MLYSILQLWDISVWYFCWTSACSSWSWFSSVELKRRNNWEPSGKPVFKTSGALPALRFYWALLGVLPSSPGDQLTSRSCISSPSLTPYKVSSTAPTGHEWSQWSWKCLRVRLSVKWLISELKTSLLKTFISGKGGLEILGRNGYFFPPPP